MKQQFYWLDSAGNKHTIYSRKTHFNIVVKGFIARATRPSTKPWVSTLLPHPKYPTAKYIPIYLEFEPVYDNSQADVVFGSEDVIPKLVEQFTKHNKQLMRKDKE